MNKKAFTLVELLAVIVILALLALITGTVVTKLVNDSKYQLSNVQKNLIKSAAEMWGSENFKKLPSPGECSYITLGDLKEYGLMENSIIDSSDNKEIPDDLKIKISTTIGSSGKLVFDYEINPISTNGCNWVYEPVCTLNDVDSTTGYIDIGDEITCGNESFYVIDKNANTVTMLSKFNINVGANAHPVYQLGIQNGYDDSMRGYSYWGYGKILYYYMYVDTYVCEDKYYMDDYIGYKYYGYWYDDGLDIENPNNNSLKRYIYAETLDGYWYDENGDLVSYWPEDPGKRWMLLAPDVRTFIRYYADSPEGEGNVYTEIVGFGIDDYSEDGYSCLSEETYEEKYYESESYLEGYTPVGEDSYEITVDSVYPKYGIVEFVSDEEYYWDSTSSASYDEVEYTGSYSSAGNSIYPYVYDDNSNVYLYVEDYENYLKDMGVNSANAKLMSYEQAQSLGCSSNCTSAPVWVYLTNYWLGSAHSRYSIFAINLDGELSSNLASNVVNGVRPVVTISTSDIK